MIECIAAVAFDAGCRLLFLLLSSPFIMLFVMRDSGRYAEPLIGLDLIGLDLIGLDLIISVMIGLYLIGLVLIG